VVAQDPYGLGRHAGELLFRRAADPRTVIVPTRLIARGSGEIPPP
jgi:LacI family transcriptional regulator